MMDYTQALTELRRRDGDVIDDTDDDDNNNHSDLTVVAELTDKTHTQKYKQATNILI
jgi:hypothetical protein